MRIPYWNRNDKTLNVIEIRSRKLAWGFCQTHVYGRVVSWDWVHINYMTSKEDWRKWTMNKLFAGTSVDIKESILRYENITEVFRLKTSYPWFYVFKSRQEICIFLPKQETARSHAVFFRTVSSNCTTKEFQSLSLNEVAPSMGFAYLTLEKSSCLFGVLSTGF